jgi:hypothetical protein
MCKPIKSNNFIHMTPQIINMDIWHYVRDIKKGKAEEFMEESMKKNPGLIYRYATARSNNPDMVAIYYQDKAQKP